MVNPAIITAIRKAIEALPERGNIRSVKLFGSYARGEEKPESDIDLIVEFKESIGLIAFVGVQLKLEEQLRHRVDLLTPRSVHPVIRKKVLTQALSIYEG